MSRKLLLSSMAVLLLQGGIALAGPGGREERPVERERGQGGRTWVWNLRGSAELVVATPDDFDPSGMEVDLDGTVRMERTGRKLTMYVDRPEWARDVIGLGSQAALQVAAGGTGRLVMETSGEAVHVAVDLLKADSAVEVAVIGGTGEVLRSLTASASTPVRWMADLGTVEAGARVELRVLRGRAAGGVIRAEGGGLRPITAAAIVGSAQFSRMINYPYSGVDLYYTVTGGPPSTCGELNSYRNGSWIFGANWLCTDASGNATKGPWTWAGTPSDQTDEPAFIRWPNGDTTNNAIHIWDKNCAQTFRTTPSGSPPTSWAGYATDTQWGAGFDFGPTASSDFKNTTTGLYWDPATGGYTASYKSVNGTLSRVNRWRVNWTTSFPSAGSHQSGHSYSWYTCVTDGGCGVCTNHTFTAP
jgi:hypothetical protein